MKRLLRFMYVIPVLLTFSFPLYGQDLLINELCPSNTTYPDNFSNTTDWIELFNAGDSVLELAGFRLSDQPDFASAWTLGSKDLQPGEHLLVFASGRDISSVPVYNTVIEEGDPWKYKIPNQNLTPEWRMPGFDDGAWASGNSGIGYGDGDDNTFVPTGTRSVYLRKKFSLEDTAGIAVVLFHMDYDDAFVAYINGIEIARANIGAVGQSMPYNATPQSDHEAVMYEGGSPDLYDASFIIQFLEQGENVIALQVYNISATSTDMTAIPFLTLGRTDVASGTVPPVLNLPENKMHADFKLSSEGETVYLFSPEGAVLDSVTYPWLPPGISFGRQGDGMPVWGLFPQPTPDSVNTGVFYNEIISEPVHFSHPSGIYGSPLTIELSGSDHIRFTTDCSDPGETSAQYTGPLTISSNTIIKAAIFEPGKLGRRFVRNYLLDAVHTLPVIALNTEPEFLWDEEIGMYVLGNEYESSYPYFGANFWEDWEYPFHFSLFNQAGDLLYEANAGGKIFGAWSRALDQKSFALFARAELGTPQFTFPFFEERPYSTFESIVLRNSGNDWEYSMLRDAVMTSLMKGSRVDYQAYQPVVTYMNGEYWGIYNMREKINEHYIGSLHGISFPELNILQNDAEIKYGDNAGYVTLREFIEDNSLAADANYKYVTDRIDEVNFIQYQVAQIYYNNNDWPGNNIAYWQAGEGKWRWILYDTDFGLGLFDSYGYNFNSLAFATDTDGPYWPNPPWSTLFLRKLLENGQFERKFINYFADAMNSVFIPEFANARVDSLASGIEDEMPAHRMRWGQSMDSWTYAVSRLKTFFTARPAVARNFIMNRFDLPAVHTIRVKNDTPNRGSVRVNSLIIEAPDWSGKYFQDNAITLTAFPKPGYAFDHWAGDVASEEFMIDLNLDHYTEVTAHFIPAGSIEQPVVINEINYNSPESPDPSDWVELHNFSDAAVDITGWTFSDSDTAHAFVLPDNTIMEAGGYLVLCRDSSDFSAIFPALSNFVGGFEFGLSSEGDAVCLYDKTGMLMDSVRYLPGIPWPPQANGQGPTLELLSPELDNSLPASWHAFQGTGTPGSLNHYISGIAGNATTESLRIYPNPAGERVELEIDNSTLGIISVSMYNLMGSLQLRAMSPAKDERMSLNIAGLPPGQYLVLVALDDGKLVRAMLQKK